MNNKNNKIKNKSICQIEGWDWKGEIITIEDDGMTAYRWYKLTQEPIKNLSHADISFLITQEIGLPYLVPVALDILKTDFFIETEYYKGDLVMALLKISDDNKYDYWPNHPVEKAKFCELYKNNQQNMEASLEYYWDIIKEIKRRFNEFSIQSDKESVK
jgi:hypothetical protein